MPKAMIPRDKQEEQFVEYMTLARLADRTIREYQIYYRIFPHSIPLTEEVVWAFLNAHKGNIARAFVKLYLQFKKVRDIDIPKRRGAQKTRLYNLISEDEYRKLRRALYERNIKYGLMFDLSFWCGLRREEVCTIEPSWIILEEYQEGKPLRIKIIGKRNKERIAVVPPDVAGLLLRYIKEKFNALELGNKDRLFGIGAHYWWEVLTDMSFRVLGKRYKPHELRHTRATIWLKDGVDLIKIQKRLGHANLSTTERYTHITTEEVATDWEDELKKD